MLAQVGQDDDGQDYIRFLDENQINTEGVRCTEDTPTGMAFIMSEKNGDNAIIINGGANMNYGNEIEQSWKNIISQCNLLLLQREVPEKINILAAKFAKSVETHEVTVILDMGGRDEQISQNLVELCDIISPNEVRNSLSILIDFISISSRIYLINRYHNNSHCLSILTVD